MNDNLKVAIIQISPIFLNKKQTWSKLKKWILEAIKEGSELITWGETLLPGYPQWLSQTHGSKFNDENQKRAYATYVNEALPIDDPIINEMKVISKEFKVILVGGILERSGTAVYCTAITIQNGKLLGRHRKIKPTYEERLVWSDGDSKGLMTYPSKIGNFGVLNCWENWLPLARASLHRMGEIIHISLWPGSVALTKDISRFMALEGRSWQIVACGLLSSEDFRKLSVEEFPQKSEMLLGNKVYQNGGSVIMNPRGEVVAGPLINEEGIVSFNLDLTIVLEERQNLDISGHYSRFDIFNFGVNY